MTDPKPLSERPGHSLLIIRLIAIEKVLKSASLLVVGIFILRMLHLDHTLYGTLHDFVNDLRLDENNHFIHGLLERATGVSDRKLRFLSAGTFIYSALYLTEGLGLYFDRAWAEWLTIITTAGFLPLEIMEIVHDTTAVKLIVFALNIVMVVYLVLRLRWRHLAKKAGVDVHIKLRPHKE